MRDLELIKHFLKCIDDPSVDWREEKAKLEFIVDMVELRGNGYLMSDMVAVLIGEVKDA